MTAVLLRLVAIAILLLAGGMAALQYNSRSWPSTEGVVGSSGWARESGLRGAMGVYEVNYEYSVDGKNHGGNRVSFAGNVSMVHVIKSYQGEAINTLRSPHPGDTIRVHYAPWWPAVSVLMPGPSPVLWIWCVAAGLVAIACLVFARLSRHPVF